MPATHRGPGPAHPAAAAGRLVRRLRGLLRPAGRPCAAGRGGEPWPGHSSTSSTRRPAGRWLPSRSRTAPRTARLAAGYRRWIDRRASPALAATPHGGPRRRAPRIRRARARPDLSGCKCRTGQGRGKTLLRHPEADPGRRALAGGAAAHPGPPSVAAGRTRWAAARRPARARAAARRARAWRRAQPRARARCRTARAAAA